MNEKKNNTWLSIKSSDIVYKDVAVSTESSSHLQIDDGRASSRSIEDVCSTSLSARTLNDTVELRDREPMFVIVDSSYLSNPSSRELLIEDKNKKALRKHVNKHVQPIDMPSTSRDFCHDLTTLKRSDSNEELQMIDINLQSENEILLDENDVDDESIVMSYLRNKDTHLELEDYSETSLDVLIPSFPGSPRSLNLGSRSIASLDGRNEELRRAVDFLHDDNEFLLAAELGDELKLEYLLRQGVNRHSLDHLGRTALHLAVMTKNVRTIRLLLDAGINPNIKDNVGMTPLSLCLMRSPSVLIANLLFNYGAKILPRSNPMDTGLFMQFVMMCIPTREEEKILELLVNMGALVNDPDAPGGRQALHIAAMGNNCRLIEILTDLGANIFLVNHRGETPKEFALAFKCKEAAALLDQLEAYAIHNLYSADNSNSTFRSESNSRISVIERSSDNIALGRDGTSDKVKDNLPPS